MILIHAQEHNKTLFPLIIIFLNDVYLDDALTDTLVDEDSSYTLGISQNRTSLTLPQISMVTDL